ncbi:26S proteasome subunit RPN7-domain-containing protein [Phyllosticta citrichinensis]|uniref:26S proteasome subunit RPN7-domain-containing protein n=1 Tax=Phyllosticta citrichinensis TaxID=1130410 RepID=A0ABR1XN79_9PEZI
MAPNVEDSPFFKDAKAQGRAITRDPPKFDFESYIANYEGRTRLERLHHIGITSTYLSTDALRTAITEAKHGKDVEVYNTITDRLHTIDPDDPLGVPDTAWLERKTKEVKAEMESLEQQLKQYKNNLIKESIRMGYDDLGQFYTSIGEHNSAMKAFARERDYCTSTQHVADMSLKQIYSGIQQRSWTSVHSNVSKIQPMSLKAEEKAKLEPICAAVMGLSHLASGNFRDAARQFLAVNPSFMTADTQAGIAWQRQVLTGNDIAVYGGLCALASMDRSELQKHVLENSDFRSFLELEPHVRRAISLFCGSKYTQCLEILEAYRTDYLLDYYLHPRVKDLYSQVRSKSIVQYFIPFSCVTLDEMGKAFASTGGVSIEDELVEMIQRGVLNARIDLVERLLVSPLTNPRTEVHTAALKMAQEYEHALRLRLVRLAMLNEGIIVRQPQSQSQNSSPEGHGGNPQGLPVAYPFAMMREETS